MQAPKLIRKTVVALCVIVVTSALIGASARHRSNEPTVALPTATPEAPARIVGVPTGEYQNGVPVYRLPSIFVTVNRSEALARMAREDSLAMKYGPAAASEANGKDRSSP